MSKLLCFGKGGLESRISLFIHLSQPIKKKYQNRPKAHKIDNLLLIAEAKKKIRVNIGVINVYMFLHSDFEGVEFYAARGYVHLKTEGRV